MAATAPEPDDVPSDGPWAQAWKRLRRNRMAMAGLVVVLAMALSAVLAPWIVPFDPREMERWTGALAPGTRHLELCNEMVVERGKAPRPQDVPTAVGKAAVDGAAHVWRIEVQDEVTTLLRVTVDGGKIQQIGEGGKRHTTLEIAEDEFIRVKDGGAVVRVPVLAVGGVLPAPAPQQAGRFVVMVERVKRPPEAKRTVEIALGTDGKVTTVTSAGVPVDGEMRVRAENVRDTSLDGARIEHSHPLGTDQEGRDVLARVLFGARISLLVGIVATFVSLSIGVFYGAIAGFAGGRTDVFMMRVVDVLYALPYIFLVIILLVAFGRSLVMLFIALGLVQWLTPARVVRGQILSLKRREFVDASVTLGATPWTILIRHLIPNTMGVVVVFTTLTIPAVILEESFLSFIGLTVLFRGEPIDSWGALVDYGRNALGGDGERWWLLVFPAAAMSLTLFSLNFLGDGLRDALDPRQKGRG
ncbi:MAG: ABC transporter permease [Planctomycetes bacterium]|nr:ABC transporter permease [Planctomycetota bacterium]